VSAQIPAETEASQCRSHEKVPSSASASASASTSERRQNYQPPRIAVSPIPDGGGTDVMMRCDLGQETMDVMPAAADVGVGSARVGVRDQAWVSSAGPSTR
jgi:hypothetical protein